jgi:hypothetical protein
MTATAAGRGLGRLDTLHVTGRATGAIDEVRREEWNELRAAGAATAKDFKGLRLPLLAAGRALDDWLTFAYRSPPRPVRAPRPHHPLLPGHPSKRPSKGALTNGIAEFNNASISRIRANARRFHDPEAFITMVMLDRAGITLSLPWTPDGRT